MQLTDEQRRQIDFALEMLLCAMRAANWEGDAAYSAGEKARKLLAAHSAGAQEPIGYLPAYELERLQSGHNANLRSARFGSSQLDGDVAVYFDQPQPMPQTDAARDAEDAKRYRFIKSQMKVGAVQTQLPLYRTLHWIGYEDCSDVRNADTAIDAEIERLDRAKGE